MKRLDFTDDLVTGIEEIDRQHRQLLARGNAIIFPKNGTLDEKEIRNQLDFLIRYVNSHFAAEEELMEFYGFSRLEGHRKQHERLHREVENLVAKMKKMDSVKKLASELYFLLNDWYVYHIKEWDKAYAVFLQEIISHDAIKVPELEDMDGRTVNIVTIDDQLVYDPFVFGKKTKKD